MNPELGNPYVNSPASDLKLRSAGVLLTWLTLTALIGTLFGIGPFLLMFTARWGVPVVQLTTWIMMWSNLAFPVSLVALGAEVLAIVVFLAGLFLWRSNAWNNRRWQLCARGIGFTGILIILFYYFFFRQVAVPSQS